jgi:ferredoxin-NADP reductase
LSEIVQKRAVRSSLRHLKPVTVRGPLALAVLYIIPLVLWARSEPLDQRFSGQFATLTSIAVLCASAGTSAFALNLVLGARLRPAETLFGGLDRMYRVHRINGQLAFVLLLGHFALILASRATLSATTALDLLGPGAGWTVFAGFLADYTRALRSLEVGANAVVEGPYGSFSHQYVPRARQLWIAGGIGVTPFLSMARGLGDHDSLDVDFYYCVERAEEAHFLDELQAIAERYRGFRIVVVPRDRDGFPSVERLAAEHDDLERADVMICGPPAMIESLRAQLAAAGVPQAQIHAEEFGFAKLGGGTETTPAARITRASGETAIIPRRRSGAHVLMALLFAAVVFAAGIIVGRHTAPHAQPATAEPATAAPGSAAAGNVGPNLDRVKPDAAHVCEVVTNGKGAMPPYKGRLTDKQISDVAAYVAQATA